jgi:hypothetical protein
VALAGSDVHVLGGPTLAERVAERQQNIRLSNYLTATFFRPYLPMADRARRRTRRRRTATATLRGRHDEVVEQLTRAAWPANQLGYRRAAGRQGPT